MGFNKRIITRESIINTYLQRLSVHDVVNFITKPDSVQLSNDEFINDIYNHSVHNDYQTVKKILENYIYNK